MEQPPPPPVPGDDGSTAKRQSDQQGYGKAEHDKRERDRRPGTDLRDDRSAADGGYAKIAMQQSAKPVDVLYGQRPVESHLRPQCGDTGRGRVRSGHYGCNVTGEYTQCQKHQYRQSHQCRYEQQQPFGHESHIIPPWKSAIAAVPSG